MPLANVLIVEDDEAMRSIQAEILEDVGYKVTVAKDGELALQILSAASEAEQPISVIVSDIYMGAVSGIDVIEAARSQPAPPEVVLVTGAGTLETAMAALRAGAHDYLLKPVEPERLRSVVAAAEAKRAARSAQQAALHAIAGGLEQLHSISRGGPGEGVARSRAMQVGPLTLDTDRHAARWNGRPLPVTPIEYALLRYLAETPGRVRGYSDIVSWTHGHQISNEEAKLLIKSHVRNLRRKIDQGYLIHVRGGGYMLLPEPQEEGSPEAGGEE